ncbi:CRISPR-associated protein [Pyrobaculum sp.]|uniref:CRISPR-associated protein n=1 Tax=Pyrobaculum sp. TaxID=2004705 RepID=UPI00315FC7E4
MAILKLKVETPLFVLGGVSAVVGLDAFYKDGKLYLVDLASSGVLSQMREPSLEAAVQLVARDPARYSYASFPSPQIPEKAEVKIGKAPPASTIKGLLRTAYLRYVLERDSDVAAKFLNAVKTALEERVHPKILAWRGEEVVFRRYFDKRRFDLFNLVHVKELSLRPNYRVYKVDVVEGGSVKASFYAIGAAPGSEFEYLVEVAPFFKESGEKEQLISIDDLRSALDLFAKEVAEFERSRGRLAPCGRGVRLGFGAGRRWKTVLSFIQKRDPQLYESVGEYIHNRLKRVWGDLTVKIAEGKPVGWACYEWS